MATKTTVSESRKACEAKLVIYPKYDSNWVQNAAKLMDEYKWTVEDLDKFNASQLDIIYNAEGYLKDIFITDYKLNDIANPELNSSQMNLMLAGWQNNIPVDVIAKFVSPEIPYEFSSYALQAYLEGNDMTAYINNGYDRDQFYEIFCGFHNKIDVNKYADPRINARVMGIMRHALEIGYNVITYDFGIDSLTITSDNKMPC